MNAIGVHASLSGTAPASVGVGAPAKPHNLVLAGAAMAFAFALGLSVLHLDGFDFTLIRAMNVLSHRSLTFDMAMYDLTLDTFSNALFVSVIWYAWFASEDRRNRAGILIGTVMSFAGAGVSRSLQRLMPTHPRPLHNPALALRLPFSVDPQHFPHWSSFASDHATVYFGMAAMIWMYGTRQLRWIVSIATICFSLVRVYLCLHYPTDVIGGAALGVMMVVATRNLRFGPIGDTITRLEAKNKPLFYGVAFYACFGFATLFNEFRVFGHTLVGSLKHLHHG